MTLEELLIALKDNPINITLVDSEDKSLITFNAGGYESIESDLFNSIVDTITVSSSKLITIKLTGN